MNAIAVQRTGASAMAHTLNTGKLRPGVPPVNPAAGELEGDIRCAVASAAPVLITGPLDAAYEIACSIHRFGRAASPLVAVDVDGSTGVDSIRQAFESAEPDGVLVLRSVDRLAVAEQPALRGLLDRFNVRVIATSAVNLFAVVEGGAFDERLFYRLNQIHLMTSVQ